MIRIWTSSAPRAKFEEIPNGPFPITREQLDEARRRYREEWNKCKPLEGVRISPQTAARDILQEVVPTLSAFDRGMIGFAVSCDRVRITT